MLGNSNYIDLTGQMEEVFDSKISQIKLVTEESLKDQIEEAVAEVVIKPEIFDDVYAKIDHTHTNFDNLTTKGLDIGKFGIKTQGDNWASLKMNGSDWIGMNTETSNMTLYKNTTVSGNLTVRGLLNEYAISGDSQYKYYEQKFIPTIRNNGIMEIGKYKKESIRKKSH